MARAILKIAGLFYLVQGVSFVPRLVSDLQLLQHNVPFKNLLPALTYEVCSLALFSSVGLFLILGTGRIIKWLGIVDTDNARLSCLPFTFRQLLVLLGIYFMIDSSAGLAAFTASLVRLWPQRITHTAFMSYPEALPPAIKAVLGLCLVFASSKITKLLGFFGSNDSGPLPPEREAEKNMSERGNSRR